MTSIPTPTQLGLLQHACLLELPDEDLQGVGKAAALLVLTRQMTVLISGARRSLSADIQSSDVIGEQLRSRSPERKSLGNKYVKKVSSGGKEEEPEHGTIGRAKRYTKAKAQAKNQKPKASA